MTGTRKPRKRVIGVVAGDRMQKTITVEIVRVERHPRYHKYVRRTTRYKAHDAENEARVGDTVEIAETRPLSKTKRWRLVRILERSRRAAGVVP